MNISRKETQITDRFVSGPFEGKMKYGDDAPVQIEVWRTASSVTFLSCSFRKIEEVDALLDILTNVKGLLDK
ncbi:MAG: hypothetical protein M0R06_01340 [Sphaerochaeta sp.]|jgi:hypothetical protein|nr:hypothetical protein [Sphaerochaeta sp.]